MSIEFEHAALHIKSATNIKWSIIKKSYIFNHSTNIVNASELLALVLFEHLLSVFCIHLGKYFYDCPLKLSTSSLSHKSFKPQKETIVYRGHSFSSFRSFGNFSILISSFLLAKVLMFFVHASHNIHWTNFA